MAPQELDVRGGLSLHVGTVLPRAWESAGVSQDSCQINRSHGWGSNAVPLPAAGIRGKGQMSRGGEKQSPEGRREDDKDPHYMTWFITCQGGGRQNLELKAGCYLHRTAAFLPAWWGQWLLLLTAWKLPELGG